MISIAILSDLETLILKKDALYYYLGTHNHTFLKVQLERGD